MELTTVLSLLLVAAFLTVLLRQYRPELAMGLSVGAGAVVLLAVLKAALPAVSQLRALLEGAALPQEYTAILFKGLGICLLTQLTADTCRDAGETALAAKAELTGKLLLVLLSLPLFEKITALALSLLQE